MNLPCIFDFCQLAYRKGEIPKYLKEMKLKENERNQLISQIDVNCPPGHTVLTEAERIESLNIAQKSMFKSHGILSLFL